MIKTILKVKKPTVTMSIPPPVPVATPVPVAAPVPEKKKTILKVKKPTVAMAMPKPLDPEPVQAKKIILKLKKKVPPPPAPGVYVTKAMEAFEAIREYYTTRGQQIPEADIKWYQEELIQEKKEMDAFWERCAETKVNMELL